MKVEVVMQSYLDSFHGVTNQQLVTFVASPELHLRAPPLQCSGFSRCTKMVPVKSHNDLSRPLVKKGVVRLEQELFL